MKLAILACALLTAAVPARAANAVSIDDLLQMRRVSTAAISPDGRWVVFAVRQWEPAAADNGKKEARSQVWRARTSGAGDAARPLTFDPAGADSPAWSPDGRYVSFLSARGGGESSRPQVWIMRTDGGEAVKITDAPDGVASYAWSADGRRIAFVAREAEGGDAEARRKRGDDRRVFEDEFRLSHLWVADVESAAAVRVTEGTAFTIRGAVSWAPDGTRITFAAAPTPMLRDDRLDVYVATLGDRQVEKITTNSGTDAAPVWSPDGTTIAFLSDPGSARPGPDGLGIRDPRQSRLTLYKVRTREIVDAFDAAFDIEPRDLLWTPDSRRLIFTAGRGTYNEAFSYEPSARRYARLTTNRLITLGTVSKDGSAAAFVMESAERPPDVFTSDLSFAAPRQLTTMNPQAASFALGASEVVSWKSDGLDIEGVLVKPVGYQSGTRVPLLVVIHGGPAGAHHNTFRVSYGDGGQHWAGQGWAVLYPNPRGGTNYGERFLRANIPDWGGGDYRDIIAGVDAMIANGIADPDRLAVQGWSYGGYMTAWTITQTTRFKAAMVGAGITNLWSMYGTNDLPNYLAAFFNGNPSTETLPLYLERSALTHAHKVTTPTLFLHGASDERVPIGQPMEFYRAIKERGTPVELVFYPRQGHGLQEYFHQRDRLQRQFDWISKYTLRDQGRKTTSQ